MELLKYIYFHSKTPTTESVAQKCSVEMVLLQILQNLQKKHLWQSLFFKVLSIKKGDSGTGVFLWILRNF